MKKDLYDFSFVDDGDYSLKGCFKQWLRMSYFFDRLFYKYGIVGADKFNPRFILYVLKGEFL